MTTSTALRSNLLPLFVALAAAPAMAAQEGATGVDEPFVELSVQDAAVRAEKEQRLVLIYFHSDAIAECKRMVSQTWSDEAVRRWLDDNTVAIKIADTDKRALARFKVSSFPYVLLLEADMGVLHKFEHFHDATDFLIAANSAALAVGNVEKPSGETIENPMAWLAWANWLFANAPDKPVDCLEAYTWCLDNGDDFLPGFRERHFDFLLERIAYLKARTADAVAALWDRRTRLQSEIVAGIANERDVWELVRFNFWLRTQMNNLEVFDELKGRGEAQDALRETLMRLELQQFVAWRRYKDIIEIVPDPAAEIVARVKAFQKAEVASGRTELVDDAASFFEVLLAEARGGDAMQVFNVVTDAVPTGRAYYVFIDRALRLEYYPLARKMAEKGLGVVNEKGRRKIEMQLKQIPADDAPTAAPPTDGDGGR